MYNLRRADRKGDKGKQQWDGPYNVAKVIQHKGLYQLTTLDGKQIKTKHNGANLKPYVRNHKQKTN